MPDFETHRQHGFLLTRHAQDVRRRNNLSISGSGEFIAQTQTALWGWTPNGTVKLTFDDQKPLFFAHQDHQDKASRRLKTLAIRHECKPLTHLSFENKPVTAFYFSTIDDHFKAKQALSHIDIETFEHDLRLQDKFLFERNIHGSFEFIGKPTERMGYTEYTDVKIKPSTIKPEFSVISLDIECSMEGELYSIGLYGHAPSPNKNSTAQALARKVIMIGDEEPLSQSDLDILWVQDLSLIHI